jgi:hypothetical protein
MPHPDFYRRRAAIIAANGYTATTVTTAGAATS